MGNRDGFALMYVDQVEGVDRVVVKRSMAGWQDYVDLYEKNMNRDIAVHVRNASFGMEKNIENCHGFKVLSLDDGDKLDLFMMHNGKFGEIQVDKKYSDSWNFATKFIRGYLKKHPTALQDTDFQYLLAGIIGPNKLVFLDNKKRFTIINADLGAIHPTGVWVSTKQEIKIYSYVNNTPSTSQTGSTVGMQFGQAPAWSFSKGEWEHDSDNRLHFVADSVPKTKSEKTEKDTTIPVKVVEDATDSGTTKNAVGLKELIKEIPIMSTLDLFNFVVQYHEQTLTMLNMLKVKEDEGKLKLMIASSPWEVAEMLKKHVGQLAQANANLN